mgnify:CR=1 FL=1
MCAAAGSVGQFAVQLARNAGARVVAVASPANHDYLRSLGAHECVDYCTGTGPSTQESPGGGDGRMADVVVALSGALI